MSPRTAVPAPTRSTSCPASRHDDDPNAPSWRFLSRTASFQAVAAFGAPLDPDSHIFTADEGGPVRQANFRNRVWAPACRAAGLSPAPRIHDLRHTAASLAIAAGANPKVIQEMLGHSSIVVTMDRYGHLFDTLQDDLAERQEALYGA